MEFKDSIRGLRLDKGLSYTQLAAILKKSESAIRMWESGKSKPDADTLIHLSKMFNCSVDYLLGLSDFENKETKEFIIESLEEVSEKYKELPSKVRYILFDLLAYIIDGYCHLESCPKVQDQYLLGLYEILKRLSDITDYPNLARQSNIKYENLGNETPWIFLFYPVDKQVAIEEMSAIINLIELEISEAIELPNEKRLLDIFRNISVLNKDGD